VIYLKNTAGFWGVYARGPISQGETVYVLRPFASRATPTRTSIQISEGLHAEDEVGRYINHSFEPTCEIDGGTVRALKDLAFGEEITFDYTINESYISSPFTCMHTGRPVGLTEESGE